MTALTDLTIAAALDGLAKGAFSARELTEAHLAFNRRDGTYGAEAGDFEVWAGADAHAHLCARFRLVD